MFEMSEIQRGNEVAPCGLRSRPNARFGNAGHDAGLAETGKSDGGEIDGIRKPNGRVRRQLGQMAGHADDDEHYVYAIAL